MYSSRGGSHVSRFNASKWTRCKFIAFNSNRNLDSSLSPSSSFLVLPFNLQLPTIRPKQTTDLLSCGFAYRNPGQIWNENPRSPSSPRRWSINCQQCTWKGQERFLLSSVTDRGQHLQQAAINLLCICTLIFIYIVQCNSGCTNYQRQCTTALCRGRLVGGRTELVAMPSARVQLHYYYYYCYYRSQQLFNYIVHHKYTCWSTILPLNLPVVVVGREWACTTLACLLGWVIYIVVDGYIERPCTAARWERTGGGLLYTTNRDVHRLTARINFHFQNQSCAINTQKYCARLKIGIQVSN